MTEQSNVARIITLADKMPLAPDAIVSQTLFKAPFARVVLFSFAQGEELSEHTSPLHVVVQIVCGKCEFTVGSERRILVAGDVVYMPPNLPSFRQGIRDLFYADNSYHKLGAIMTTSQSLPGGQVDGTKAPGHWLLARLGKRVLRPGGLHLTRRMLASLRIKPDDDVIEFGPGLGATARLALSKKPHSYVAIERDENAAAIAISR